MRLVGIEGKWLAIKAGNIDSDGVHFCTVIADEQLEKRSYKSKYDALSRTISMDKK